MEIFAFCVITFEQISFKIYQASQTDRLNLSFVKDELTMAKKFPERVVKQSFLSNFGFPSVFTRLK